MAEKASAAEASAAVARLKSRRLPKANERETSSRKSTVCSRSSTNFLTCRSPVREVTFQSTERMSSPGAYSRTSENSIPCPLKVLR